MRLLVTLVLLVLCSFSLSAEQRPSDPVRVYLFTEPTVGGFTDPQQEWRETAVGHAIARVRKDKAIRLVSDRTEADVVVEVLRVSDNESDSTWSPGPGVTKRMHVMRVHATLTAGAYTTPVTAESKRLRFAGEGIGLELIDWVKANHTRVLAAR